MPVTDLTFRLAALRAVAILAVSRARATGDETKVRDALDTLGSIRFSQALNRGTPAHLIDPFDGWDLTMVVGDDGYFVT